MLVVEVLSEVIKRLARRGIRLPARTNPANFLNLLHKALVDKDTAEAARHTRPELEVDEDGNLYRRDPATGERRLHHSNPVLPHLSLADADTDDTAEWIRKRAAAASTAGRT
jgi:hypothetical protein